MSFPLYVRKLSSVRIVHITNNVRVFVTGAIHSQSQSAVSSMPSSTMDVDSETSNSACDTTATKSTETSLNRQPNMAQSQPNVAPSQPNSGVSSTTVQSSSREKKSKKSKVLMDYRSKLMNLWLYYVFFYCSQNIFSNFICRQRAAKPRKCRRWWKNGSKSTSKKKTKIDAAAKLH